MKKTEYFAERLLKRRQILRGGVGLVGGVLGGLATAGVAWAQTSSSSQTLRLVVPYAAGGGGDALARALGPKLADALKQTVIIDNKPGASGIIGTDLVIKAPPDGQTLLFHTLPMVMVPAMFDKPPYDPVRDLVPIIEMISSPLWLAVSTSRTAARNLKELTDQIRAEKGKHSYASISPGSTGHLLGFQFNEQNKLDMEHIGYKGGAPATQALLAGEVTAAFLDISTLKPHLAGGRIRLLGVSGAQRSPQTPDIATLKELGLAGFEANAWGGLFAPRGTPVAVVRRLGDTVAQLLRDPELYAKYVALGYAVSAKTQEDFAAQVQRDRDHFGALMRKTGVKPD
jgi:tripartite-type tricarboxylate transporter receptor subunit TctC